MPEIIPTKKHLLVKRAKIMKFLKSEGYNLEDIGTIFNVDRSTVLRVLAAEKTYKDFAKELLSDKKPLVKVKSKGR